MDSRIGEEIVFDDPKNVCFGCSPSNRHGLQLRFRRTGEHSIECRFRGESHLAGAPGVMHGGVQATLLDETLGVAVHTGLPDGVGIVTVDFQLRYRRPVPVGEDLVIRAELLRHDGRDFHVAGRIESAAGEELTRAEARWRRVERRGGAGPES